MAKLVYSDDGRLLFTKEMKKRIHHPDARHASDSFQPAVRNY